MPSEWGPDAKVGLRAPRKQIAGCVRAVEAQGAHQALSTHTHTQPGITRHTREQDTVSENPGTVR